MIEVFPEDEALKGNLVSLLAQQGDVKGAEDFLRTIIEQSDDKINSHVALVAFIRQTSGNDAAMAELDAALPLYEDNTS